MNYIVALPRSGTKYITTVLNDVGVTAAHEKKISKGVEIDWKNAVCKFKPTDIILHQVRNPLDVISSLSTISFAGHGGLILKHVPNCKTSSLLNFMKFYYHWNEYCESKSMFTYKIEDMNSELLEKIISLFQIKNTVHLDQFANIPTTVNTRKTKKTYKKVTWIDLKECSEEYYNLIQDQAKKYGYTNLDN